jgi:hypothetical protein
MVSDAKELYNNSNNKHFAIFIINQINKIFLKSEHNLSIKRRRRNFAWENDWLGIKYNFAYSKVKANWVIRNIMIRNTLVN